MGIARFTANYRCIHVSVRPNSYCTMQRRYAHAYLYIHTGLSPELDTMDRIRSIERPTVIPDFGVVCDLVWADPDPDLKGGSCFAVVDGMYAYGYVGMCIFMRRVCLCAHTMRSICIYVYADTYYMCSGL